jgi:NADH-quinone oxidoreductase subunit J
MEQVLFWIFGTVGIVSAIVMVAKRNPVHSALFLVVVLFCVAGIYLLLGAEFLAAIQVIVYAGAIMVLFLFVIMLINVEQEARRGGGGRLLLKACGMVVTGILLLVLVTAGGFKAMEGYGARGQEAEAVSNTGQIAEALFTEYVLPFEVTSILLLAAIVGAIVLARKRG